MLQQKGIHDVSRDFDTLIAEHSKLASAEINENLRKACDTVLEAFSKTPSLILGPICEQLTRSTKKSRQKPYFDVAKWIFDRATSPFCSYLYEVSSTFLHDNNYKRKFMGCSILIRTLAISTNAQELLPIYEKIVSDFSSNQPSIYEMEVFDAAVFLSSAASRIIQSFLTVFSRWHSEKHPIASCAAQQLVEYTKKQETPDVIPFMSYIRSDIPPSSEKAKAIWAKIAPEPFECTTLWIEFGLCIGRFEDDRLRQEISNISSDAGQFPSIITVMLTNTNTFIQEIARSLFKFGIHGNETAAFDPQSLSQILEQSDNLSQIAITFLSEMAISNPTECLPQLFPLLMSDKDIARKNSLDLLDRILKGHLEQSTRKLIATNLLPIIGDDAISVRVDIPKLFLTVDPEFIIPPLIKMLGDKSEKKRSCASASLELFMTKSDEPTKVLLTFFNCALSTATPSSPADIITDPNLQQKNRERAMGLVEKWSKQANFMLDPTPLLSRLWADPKNDIIVSFISKAAPLFDRFRLLSVVLEQMKTETDDIFAALAPMLVLRSQPTEFFTSREVMASNLFDQLYQPDKEEERSVMRLRGELCARFAPHFVIPRLVQDGLFKKFSLFVVCIAGQLHPNSPLPLVCDLFEEKFNTIERDLFIPVCDAFFFADRKRAIKFELSLGGTERMFTAMAANFQKFQTEDCRAFIKAGFLDRLLKIDFPNEQNAAALNSLFFFTYQSRQISIDSYWSDLFDIGSNFAFNTNPNVRMSALKLIGALVSNSNAEQQLSLVFERFQHIVNSLTDDDNPSVRALACQLADVLKPQPPVTEL